MNLKHYRKLLLMGPLFFVLSDVYASIITYNFSGEVTMVSDPSSLLGSARNIQVGDTFQAIYEVETDTPMTSGATGIDSTFTRAIQNFQFYINNTNYVNSDYRIQTLRNINGARNGSPADWIEITTDGGIDNYGDSYGENSYNEFIDSYLELVDLTGTALDAYNHTSTGNIPLSFDMSNFTFGSMIIIGESSITPGSFYYQIRGDITSFSNEGFQPIPVPASVLLFITGLASLAGSQLRRKVK